MMYVGARKADASLLDFVEPSIKNYLRSYSRTYTTLDMI